MGLVIDRFRTINIKQHWVSNKILLKNYLGHFNWQLEKSSFSHEVKYVVKIHSNALTNIMDKVNSLRQYIADILSQTRRLYDTSRLTG